MDRRKLDALEQWAEAPDLSELERAALAFAEAMVRTDRDVDDATFAALRRQLSETQIVQLAGWIGLQAMYASLNSALRVEAQGFRQAGSAGD